MKLFSTILADFTDEDWQDVKDGIKECMINQFEEMWTQYYLWNSDKIEDMVACKLNDFITEQFRELFNRKDMKKLFMQEMMKQISVGESRSDIY